MKQLLPISILLVIFSGQLLAQPILSQSDIGFQIGDIHTVDSTDFMDMSSQLGPNMTWDLNDLELMDTPIISSVIDASDTPNGDSFPSSTLTRRIEIPEFTLDQYFSFDASSMQHHGTSLYFGSTTVTSLYTNPEIAFPVPMSYNSSGSDSYESTLIAGPGDIETSGVINWDVPGYGTLLVNNETYNDVLLYRFVRLDTTSSTFGGFTFFTYSEETTYGFMAAGIHYPIVLFTEITTEDDFTGPMTTYEASILTSQITTGLESFSSNVSDIQVFPNPSNDGLINLEFSLLEKEDLTISIFDLTGRSVYRETITELPGTIRKQIDLSDEMEAGIYLLQISTTSAQQAVRVEIE